MALYVYKCPVCGRIEEKVAKWDDPAPICKQDDLPVTMVKTLGVPSPAQWKCMKGSL